MRFCGRLEGEVPAAPGALAALLGLALTEIASALAALEVEGFAMRGRFTPGAKADEWCSRRLLARIHRYTIKRLRAEIEPVAARDFLRFLFAWQHVTADARMEGRMRSARPSRGSKGSRRRRGRGRPRFFPRASPITSRPGSMTNASRAASPGRG
ncbi:hypothetical protein RZS28_08155 [Methylocapsa polymorpha]|uniref:Uncharacterized protein n=1 Tax=Methylocapsa polymorpha TaxID=3080828 RepID=A0ABZ0HVB4_9HYPH|nr:hypothetical protein RZS28_08155 [Methylocapsa sp. RX1]